MESLHQSSETPAPPRHPPAVFEMTIMNLDKLGIVITSVPFGRVLAGLFLIVAVNIAASQAQGRKGMAQPVSDLNIETTICKSSPYIPVDHWIYPAVMRLNAMGYANDAYLGMRPWTRASVSRMLEETSAEIEDADLYGDVTTGEAQNLYDTLRRELDSEMSGSCNASPGQVRLESSYSVLRAISGTPLQDSYHLGSTVVNDYGRPFENGFNNYSGISGYVSAGRFVLYARGEFQHAPSASGYSTALAEELSIADSSPFINPATGMPFNQATIPLGPVPAAQEGRLIEAYASVNLLNHVISLGKQDDWLGPGVGSAMAYSNNAENIYSFRINRIEPLHIPLLSRVLGPFRYDFLVGSLKGHTAPNHPWVHVEKVSFKPTRDLEFGFERTVIWGGKDHEPVTLHTFLQSFFSFDAVNATTKFSTKDPGARFGAFDFAYRLPFPRNWLTLYADLEAHDTVSPLFKPLHGCYRPGLYLSHFPGVPKLDMRAEAVNTDSSYPSSIGGRYQYFEVVQVQGYTNKGQLFGDWVGREGKGGQGWVTYHLSGDEWIQLSLRNQKAAKDFIPGGTTINDMNFQVVKRIGRDVELNGNFSYERYKAPTYLAGEQTVTTTTVQLTWYPKTKISF